LLPWVVALNHGLGRAALRVARDASFDVVHAHDWVVAHAAVMVKDGAGLPLVATMHATEAGRHQGWLPSETSKAIHTVEWWLTYESRRVVTCSEHMRWEVTRLFNLPPNKVDVVANGIDVTPWQVDEPTVATARSRWAPEGRPLLVYAGRLEYEKGVHTLLHAMPRLRRRHRGLRLVLAGVGSYEPELRALAHSLRLGRAVTFTGFLDADDMTMLTAAADVAVVPSIYEPFGIVALEAAAAGTPLVAADTGGLREIVEHGRTGLRFEAGDVDSLADAVTALMSDEVLARRLVREAREVLDREFRWSSAAERIVGIHTRAIREERALQAGRATSAHRPLHVVLPDGNLLTGDSG
jgi:glycogen(starch) synthase